ncbi:hypothetical protein [Microcoleus sp. D2_18a_B4]|uniref:hypothetical protein n=1 Tax=Microcoleus sp. D2_18a_B4 TaxID=3055329 RepID=UPI002FCFDE9F
MKAAQPKIGVRSQEPEVRRKESERRRKKKCFYQYEMLPIIPIQPELILVL